MSSTRRSSAPGASALNLVVLRGRLSRPAEHRTLPSGELQAGFDITVGPHGAVDRSETVPVVWTSPPAALADLAPDDDLVLVGRVRRRFFRVGGATQSRTEVVAEAICPAQRARKVAQIVEGAIRRLNGIG